MTFVEQSREYPLLTWGANIQVEPSGSGLTVSAIEPISDEQQEAAPDLFRAYRCAISRFGGAKRQGTNSPHIEFANADTDQKLTQFIQRFGPVVVSSLRQEDQPVHSDDFFDFPMSQTVRFAEQDLSELRNEQQLYRAALALVADLERGIEADVQTVQDCICTIAEKASYWPAQWRREQQLRMSGQGYEQQALWHFEQDNLRHLDIWKSMAIHPRQTLGQRLSKVPAALSRSETVRAGHLVICNLVNSFPSLVYLWGETAIEGPHWDLTFGIRPVLFYILRREYLSASGIAVCRNTDCRQLFEIERAGQHYCGDMCSRRQRQREYWEGRGKELRKLRIEKQKPVSVNRRSGRTPQTSQDRARKGK